ncbi:MAG: ribosome recycling factor [Gammaproteobacteria bacterium]|jgi:ribosome recycling factor|nr:ribosome recycling factor [Gammaproteobacteria bacterium]
MTINDVTTDAQARMARSIDALRQELSKLRTGRAHPSLLDHVRVSYYGSEMPLNQVANVSVQDARTLGVAPYDKGMVSAIEKAIRDSDLGLNPVSAGNLIRVPLPALTEERRKDLIKVVRHEAEAARVAIRNVRREANHDLKELVKEKAVSEDQERRAEDEVQKLTDRFVAEVDKVLQAKEADLMEI